MKRLPVIAFALLALPGSAVEPLGFFDCGELTSAKGVCAADRSQRDLLHFLPDATARFLEFAPAKAYTHPRNTEWIVDADAMTALGNRDVYALHRNHDREIYVSRMREAPAVPSMSVVTGVLFNEARKRLYAIDAEATALLSWDYDEDKSLWNTRESRLLSGYFVAGDFVIDFHTDLMWVVAQYSAVHGPSILAFDANGKLHRKYSIRHIDHKGITEPYGLHMDKSTGKFYVGDRGTGFVFVLAIPDTSAFKINNPDVPEF